MNANPTRHVLVIGGSGFVGRAIVRTLLARGHQVTLLNRGSQPVPGTAQLVADRNDAEAVEAALLGRAFDVLIDVNCYTGEQAAIMIAATEGKVRRALVISSAAVYGNNAKLPPTEDEPIGGAAVWSPYGQDKTKVEDAYRAAKQFGSCIVIRPPYVFGPGNNIERESWVWARQLSGWPVLIPGDGRSRIQFVHEDDLADAVEMLGCGVRLGFEVFNVADRQIVTLTGLVSMLAWIAGCEDKQFAVGDKAEGAAARSWFPFRDHPVLTDPTRLLEETGWSPSLNLAERFEETFTALSPEDLKARMLPNDTERAIAERLGALPS
jgi:nucleoside-diphosphate-sugar epimerase